MKSVTRVIGKRFFETERSVVGSARDHPVRATEKPVSRTDERALSFSRGGNEPASKSNGRRTCERRHKGRENGEEGWGGETTILQNAIRTR